jgi:hypothetical protein
MKNVSKMDPNMHTTTDLLIDCFVLTKCGSNGDFLEFMTEPVQFEVYTNTKLLWDVGYDNASSEHVFTGRLLKSNGTPINGQPVKLVLNDTQLTTLTTNSSGFVEFRRHFDPGNQSVNWFDF